MICEWSNLIDSQNGDDLKFGPHGYLYLGLGDDGTEGEGTAAIADPEYRAQDMSQLTGQDAADRR